MAYHAHPGETASAVPLPLKDAAERMGVSVSALRGRLKRGTIEGEKDEDGRVLVYLPADGESDEHRTEPAAATAREQDVSDESGIASPLNELIEAIQALHTDLASHDDALERLMSMHRDQFEANSGLESQIQEMGRQIEAVHTAVKTMGAAFRVHAQETDRLIKALSRTGNASPASAAGPAPAFTPPTQKQRLFGRRQSDQDETPPSDSTTS